MGTKKAKIVEKTNSTKRLEAVKRAQKVVACLMRDLDRFDKEIDKLAKEVNIIENGPTKN
jgi:hypothetical protein